MDEAAKKKLLLMIPDAVYVITAQADGQTAASTITWFSQVSFKPPLVMTALKADSRTFRVVKAAGAFNMNYLGKGQEDLAQKFFKHVEPEGDFLAGERFLPSPVLDFPFFPSMAGYLECKVTDLVERGDHAVVVAEVVGAELGPAKGPLLLSSTGWKYGG